ncbi:xanthine dehydrogenase family protein molybdopterin-binding subunit [Sphingobium lactosutens]|uniref:Aldehyde oxidase/xanthine dehydrogenase a/b hammerhead domain-containing protein n=1 Tax=Sphingobium lactosutens DS20 TaxID=1331060 RepID=T0H676_9SPHN|nr:molybdopterin cofactor-binding domain-containing protein [Sphingobium lactosutens]EQB11801.1 hypothetical protein RLDS_21985 [Sphingobium lactosutens DS20]
MNAQSNQPSRYIGKPVLRKEDLRLVTGAGRYSDDFTLPGLTHAAMVRSPYARARIVSISTAAALALPGVLAVFTGQDVIAAGLKPLVHDNFLMGSAETQKSGADIILVNSSGKPIVSTPHHLLPPDISIYSGEAVAMVVAETADIAKAAASLVDVEFEELPFVVDAVQALEPDAPQLWEEFPGNIGIDAHVGDQDATDAIFASASKVASLHTHIQRVTGVTMEPRSATGSYDPETQRYQLYAGSSGVWRHKIELALVLGVPPSHVRVIAEDVGGNFGTKNNLSVELALVTWAAKEVGRPVKWTAERGEAFASDYQGRDLTVDAELALDDDGNFLALRTRNISNLGAHFVSFQPLRKGASLMSNVYDIPVGSVRAIGAITNTASTAPFRSAGRPEAIFVMERLVDIAAQRFGFDRIELRRRNLVQPSQFPYRNIAGIEYDSGDYEGVMDAALRMIDWDGFPARAQDARAQGKRRGIGIANYVEITTGMPREKAEIRVDPDGMVELVIGTMSSGQGHETSFAQVAAELLGIGLNQVRLMAGDTDRLTIGGGSISGRSMRFACVVINEAVNRVIEQASKVVAHVTGVDSSAVTFANGVLKASEASEFTIFDVARLIRDRPDLPEELRAPLYGEHDHFFSDASFPFGAQACEVEVDLATGAVRLVDIAAVDDVGRAINPLILHGQTIGGCVQGLGQAMIEHVVYDEESGQLMTGSLMDYGLLRAESVPMFKVEISEVPATMNPMGVRSGGEGGTTPALAVFVNAVVDALKEFGVEHIEMPLTPQKVWSAIHEKAGLPENQMLRDLMML